MVETELEELSDFLVRSDYKRRNHYKGLSNRYILSIYVGTDFCSCEFKTTSGIKSCYHSSHCLRGTNETVIGVQHNIE